MPLSTAAYILNVVLLVNGTSATTLTNIYDDKPSCNYAGKEISETAKKTDAKPILVSCTPQKRETLIYKLDEKTEKKGD